MLDKQRQAYGKSGSQRNLQNFIRQIGIVSWALQFAIKDKTSNRHVHEHEN